jgi:hypothetical protein
MTSTERAWVRLARAGRPGSGMTQPTDSPAQVEDSDTESQHDSGSQLAAGAPAHRRTMTKNNRLAGCVRAPKPPMLPERASHQDRPSGCRLWRSWCQDWRSRRWATSWLQHRSPVRSRHALRRHGRRRGPRRLVFHQPPWPRT